MAPTRAAVASAAAGNEKELDKEAKQGRLVEPQLNVGNTLIKTLLDQTLGAFVNTWLFSLCMNSIKASMAHRPPYALAGCSGLSCRCSTLLSSRAARCAICWGAWPGLRGACT